MFLQNFIRKKPYYNHHAIHQIPFQNEKIVNTKRTVGPTFFHDTVNLEQYVKNILEPFEELTEKAEHIFSKNTYKQTQQTIQC